MSFLMLNIAGRALASQQLAMEVTGNNLTNATTPGYQTETAAITEAPPVPVSEFGSNGQAGQLGEGTTVTTIQRATNAFLSHSLRGQMSQTGMWKAENQILAQVQNTFQEPSASGLEEALNSFFSTYNTLSQNPANPADQNSVLQQGKIVAQTFNQMAGQISTMENQANQSIGSTVSQINGLTANLANLNQQISVVIGAGQSPVDLEDKRTQVLNQLSQLVNISYTQTPSSGAVNVYLGAQPLVDGNQNYNLSTQNQPSANGDYSAVQVVWAAPNQSPPAIASGTLAGLINVRDQSLGSYQSQLSTLAQNLQAQVQASSQYSPGLFTSTGPNQAATLSFAANSLYNGSAAGVNPGILTLYQNLNSGPASSTTGSATLLDQYTNLVDQVGTDGQNASTQYNTSHATQTDLANSLSSQVGVNVDQQSANLIQEQQSYNAAAQLVATEQAVMQSLRQAVG
jgi:flagellar hook-associated protein 1 FlgK